MTQAKTLGKLMATNYSYITRSSLSQDERAKSFVEFNLRSFRLRTFQK